MADVVLFRYLKKIIAIRSIKFGSISCSIGFTLLLISCRRKYIIRCKVKLRNQNFNATEVTSYSWLNAHMTLRCFRLVKWTSMCNFNVPSIVAETLSDDSNNNTRIQGFPLAREKARGERTHPGEKRDSRQRDSFRFFASWNDFRIIAISIKEVRTGNPGMQMPLNAKGCFVASCARGWKPLCEKTRITRVYVYTYMCIYVYARLI